MAKKVQTSSKSPSSDVQLAPRWRLVISALVIFHVAAVFLPPFTFQTSSPMGESPFASTLMGTMRWYIDAVFLNHGYAFFAPDPGPSHLVRYRLEFEGNRPTEQRTFPDINRHWPRLLYHRHFMLSEQLHAAFVPPKFPSDLPEEAMPNWEVRRDLYQARWQSFENHLKHRYGANQVSLVRVEHRLPPPEYPMGGINLQDESWYIDLSEAALPESVISAPTPPLRMQMPAQEDIPLEISP